MYYLVSLTVFISQSYRLHQPATLAFSVSRFNIHVPGI